MLRPEKMSKVSVVGAESYLRDTIETLHDLNLVHVSDYDGSYEGFENGDPLEGSEGASEKLVQIRSVINILDIDEDDVEGEASIEMTEEEIEEKLDDVLERVNSLEDERNEIRDQLREIRDQRQQLEPFVELGVDLELLRGYDTIEVTVGETKNPGWVRDALSSSEDVEEFEILGDRIVAVAAKISEGTDSELSDVLVGADFSAIEIPHAEGSPESLIDELETRENRLGSELENIEERKEALKNEVAEFALAAEEELSIKAQKQEIPLQFATTENSFVAEGWIPSDRYGELQRMLGDEIGDHIDVTELEQARYRENEHGHGSDTDKKDSPPVKQNTPSIASPFEVLVQAVNRPKYTEIDPTIIVFLTFPAFFGFMIGDIGYGFFYTLAGWFLYSKMDSEGVNSLGGVAMWAGGFTMFFGFMYGEVFGIHLSQLFGEELITSIPFIQSMNKGLHIRNYALLWIVISLIAGLIHLNIALIVGFVNDLSHGFKEAFLENLSWIITMDGLFIWVFANTPPYTGTVPQFVVRGVFNGDPIPLGFTGFPETVGFIGLVMIPLGAVLVGIGEGIKGAIEIPTYALVHPISYTRIGAILLAKGGMAFAFNMMAFGAVESHGHVEFKIGHRTIENGEELFGGVIHSGIDGIILGAIVLILGHALVFALGITSAGLQAIRLEYVEFFGKFYEGGGRKYQPFGYQRKFTKEE